MEFKKQSDYEKTRGDLLDQLQMRPNDLDLIRGLARLYEQMDEGIELWMCGTKHFIMEIVPPCRNGANKRNNIPAMIKYLIGIQVATAYIYSFFKRTKFLRQLS
ncbi:MAG: hypothetical protein Ct9H300mP29_2910 [Candidatus Neomarinimicrobiota bacterium]|nr:MAG: hypothetical protein Ct9H300mP29_2910 [Candidatus Neomarinimicrobiota bacterium]